MSDHAIANAKVHLEELRGMYIDARESENDRGREANEAGARDYALSVEVRSPWYDPVARSEGTADDMPAEFRIILATGAPIARQA